MKHHNSGFTLVEASVVLVLTGLIVAGILLASDLVLLGKRTGILTEASALKSAIHTFHTKYNKLPGDFHLADRAFPNCRASSTADQPCNGNQDGLINEAEVDGSISGEQLRAWQHMLEAGVMEGSFSGVLNGSDAQEIGVNLPHSPLEIGAFWLRGGHSAYLGIYRPNSLVIGSLGFKNAYTNGAMDASLALAIDAAGDDGSPYTGNIRVTNGRDAGGAEVGNCATGSGVNANYNPQSEVVSCVLEFILE